MLSAEPLLESPSLFSDPPFAPPTDAASPLPVEGDKNCELLLEYLELTETYTTPLRMVKGHIHKMVGPWLSEFTDLRDWLNKETYANMTADALRKWTLELSGRINHVRATEGRLRPIPRKSERALAREAAAEGLAASIAEQEREESAVAGECVVLCIPSFMLSLFLWFSLRVRHPEMRCPLPVYYPLFSCAPRW